MLNRVHVASVFKDDRNHIEIYLDGSIVVVSDQIAITVDTDMVDRLIRVREDEMLVKVIKKDPQIWFVMCDGKRIYAGRSNIGFKNGTFYTTLNAEVNHFTRNLNHIEILKPSHRPGDYSQLEKDILFSTKGKPVWSTLPYESPDGLMIDVPLQMMTDEDYRRIYKSCN